MEIDSNNCQIHGYASYYVRGRKFLALDESDMVITYIDKT